MIDQANNLLDKISTKAGWDLCLVTKETLRDSKTLISSFKRHIAQSALNEKDLPVDAINFSGENPFIYFKKLSTIDLTKIRELHRKIWNEGRIPLLGIITPQEVRLYDCFDTPASKEEDLQSKQRGKSFRNTLEDIEEISMLLHQSKIDSGSIWEENFGKSILIKNRVDRKLVHNLSIARQKLHENYAMPFNIIHDLLGRSLFSLYLQDRGILTPEIFPDKKDVKDFFELLDYPKASIKLFDYLKTKFNGDLFPVTDVEKQLVENNPNSLKLVKDCFYGKDIISGQTSFDWRIFQFQYIPIELISSIYEEFMSEEDENHEKIKNGAFYTPPMLVEFLLNEVLPYPDEQNTRYDLKILDPACGSGIFLVECYKRLIARWIYSNKKEELTEEILQGLLLDNIYGIEYDSEAIKVSAFSLYLTYLNSIKPTKVLSKDVRFEQLIWRDKNQSNDKKNGCNLFHSSTFVEGLPVFEKQFDLVVGNPPWLRGNLKDDVKAYINKRKIPADIVCAYLDYMPEVAPAATIALISKAKVLFNTEPISERFRQNIFIKNNVDAIINLSVVRDVIFENATSPAAVIIYRKKKENENTKDYVTYCVPKNEAVIRSRKSIVIDASDIKFIPLNEIRKENSKVFKIAMWGNSRDAKLLERFSKIKTLKSILPEANRGTALHKAEKKAGNLHLKNSLFFGTEKISQYYVSPNKLKVLGDYHEYFRPIDKDIFTPPLVVVKEGTENGNICAAYIGFDCAYKAATLGIKFKGKSNQYHKALTALINSSFAHYFLFLRSASWGIDKAGRNQNNTILELPALLEEMSKKVILELSHKVDEIITIKSNVDVLDLNSSNKITNFQKEIDEIIYNELELSTNERHLILDVLNYSIALHNRYKESKAERLVKDISDYAKALANALSCSLKSTLKGAWVEVIETKNNNEPVRIVAIHFDNVQTSGRVQTSKSDDITPLLSQINKDTFNNHSESVYYRKLVKYYKGDKIFLVKPNQKRFWSVSQALNDADGILIDLMT